VSTLWPYFWPPVGAGIVIGVIAGLIAFRGRHGLNLAFAIGAGLSIALAALWHGPLGAADRFAREVDLTVRSALIYNEIPEVSGHLHRGPLTRRVMLYGPADDFQRSELVRVMGEVPGVGSASWSNDGGGTPLIAEGVGAGVVGFLLGVVLAYLIDRRRRYNAEWKW
jgi:hypothetical protein